MYGSALGTVELSGSQDIFRLEHFVLKICSGRLKRLTRVIQDIQPPPFGRDGCGWVWLGDGRGREHMMKVQLHDKSADPSRHTLLRAIRRQSLPISKSIKRTTRTMPKPLLG